MFIDVDNVFYKMVKEMMEELVKFGILMIKCIYGDWIKFIVCGWK